MLDGNLDDYDTDKLPHSGPLEPNEENEEVDQAAERLE